MGDTFRFLRGALKDGKNILLEGQLGALKDPDYGIYPMVISSSTLAGYGAIGAVSYTHLYAASPVSCPSIPTPYKRPIPTWTGEASSARYPAAAAISPTRR